MSLLRPFRATDLFKFNNINLDSWTETYSVYYYLTYLSNWPDLFLTQVSPNGNLMGYVMGKTESYNADDWHAHVSAITVSPSYRRLGIGSDLMALFEKVGDFRQAYFVDLFVRPSNESAVDLYEMLGYSVYRRIKAYYAQGSKKEEDAFDMRKPLARDKGHKSVRADGRNHIVTLQQAFSQYY